MPIRVSQDVVEVLLDANGQSRVSQSVIEVLLDANGQSRVSQVAIEVLVDAPAATPSQTYGPPLQVI